MHTLKITGIDNYFPPPDMFKKQLEREYEKTYSKLMREKDTTTEDASANSNANSSATNISTTTNSTTETNNNDCVSVDVHMVAQLINREMNDVKADRHDDRFMGPCDVLHVWKVKGLMMMMITRISNHITLFLQHTMITVYIIKIKLRVQPIYSSFLIAPCAAINFSVDCNMGYLDL